jgi:spore coat protein U-like protein
MTLRRLSAATALAAGISFAGPLQNTPADAATATAQIAVTATVLSVCLITATPLAFGNYTSTQLDATATLAVSCTVGTPYTIALDAGTGSEATVAERRMTGSEAGQQLSYSLYSNSARTSVWGTTTGTDTVAGTGTGLVQNLSVYGRVPAGQLAAPGAYTDTVTATLTY